MHTYFCSDGGYNTEYNLHAEIKVENNLVSVGDYDWGIRERLQFIKQPNSRWSVTLFSCLALLAWLLMA